MGGILGYKKIASETVTKKPNPLVAKKMFGGQARLVHTIYMLNSY